MLRRVQAWEMLKTCCMLMIREVFQHNFSWTVLCLTRGQVALPSLINMQVTVTIFPSLCTLSL